MNKEEALKIYAYDTIKLCRNKEKDEEKYFEALRYLDEHNLMDEAREYAKEVAEKNYLEIERPIRDELLSFLEEYSFLHGEEYKKRGFRLKEQLEEYDNLYAIRSSALEKFFKSEKGLSLSIGDKILIAMKIGALDTRDL